MKLEIATTSVKQEANTVLGTKEKELYYLIIGEGDNKLVINVGQKTHDSVKELTKPREEKTTLQIFPPEEEGGKKK